MSVLYIAGTIMLAWAILGVTAFIDFWTLEYDLTTGEIPLLLIATVGGPFLWLHRIRWPTERVLIKRRGQS